MRLVEDFWGSFDHVKVLVSRYTAFCRVMSPLETPHRFCFASGYISSLRSNFINNIKELVAYLSVFTVLASVHLWWVVPSPWTGPITEDFDR